MNTQERISLERWIVAVLVVALAVLIAGVAGVACGVPVWVGMLVASILGLISCPRIARRLPHEWDGQGRSHVGWSILVLVVGLAAVARTAGVAWFIANPTQTQGAVYRFDPFYTAHSCFSGYWRGAELARARAQNLYDTSHYNNRLGRFEVDEFLYVPQFLILPRIALALGGDFYKTRAAWFALEATLLGAASLGLCLWIGGPAGRRAALLLPALWVSTPVLATLQIGNFQVAALALSMLAMVFFDSNRPRLGGALLAVAAFKLFPGLLCVYLATAKRWQAVCWTIAFSFLYCAAAYLWMGGHPFEAFLHYDLPRLVNGTAWSFAEDPDVTAINDSVPGLVLKLKILGVSGMTHSVEDSLAWAWTALVVTLAVLAGLRGLQMTRGQRICCWLSLLTLAAFRVRFTPDIYGLIAPLWLWTFITASATLTWRNKVWLALAWVALNAVVPFDGLPFGNIYRLLISTVSQILATALCLNVLLGYSWRSPVTQEVDSILTSTT